MATRHTLIETDHTPEEWEDFQNKIEALSYEQLKDLTKRLGIHFAEGAKLSRDDFINVLDEAYWDDFEREYSLVSKAEI